MKRSTVAVCILALAATTLGVVNAVVMARNLELRARVSVPADALSLARTSEEPRFRVYFFFSPAQCSSHFLETLNGWDRLFEEFHGSRVWMTVVSTHSSRAELGRFWEALGDKQAVVVDEAGTLLGRFGLRRTPARIIVDREGDVIYREEFPDLRSDDHLSGVLGRLFMAGDSVDTESRKEER